MQTVANGHAEDASCQEGQHQCFGCELSRPMESVGNELVGEEFGHLFEIQFQVCLVTFLHLAVGLPLLDRYQNLELLMLNSMVIVGALKPVEHHIFPSTLEVKILVAQEEPFGRLGVSVVICL